LSVFYDTLITGLSNLAKQGKSQTELMQGIKTAMLIWPSDVSD